MEFKLEKLDEQFFRVVAIAGTIPNKPDPSTIPAIVRRLKRDFGVNPDGVTFDWPHDEQSKEMTVRLVPRPEWMTAWMTALVSKVA